jgi:hypothetical protein
VKLEPRSFVAINECTAYDFAADFWGSLVVKKRSRPRIKALHSVSGFEMTASGEALECETDFDNLSAGYSHAPCELSQSSRFASGCDYQIPDRKNR